MTCDPALQFDRVIRRGHDEEDAAGRIAAQGDIAARLRPAATRVIDTSGPIEGVRSSVEGALAEALGAGRP